MRTIITLVILARLKRGISLPGLTDSSHSRHHKARNVAARLIRRRQSAGFTLIELTIAFVIISILMAGGMKILSAQVNISRQSETKSRMEAIRTALMAFILRNNRLPCPAVPGLIAGDAGYGLEAVAVAGGTCTDVPSFGALPSIVSTGVIPWVSLGLSEDFSTDGHYNRFTYQVASKATDPAPHSASGMRGYIAIHSAGPGTPGAAPAGNQLNDCSAGAAFNPCAAVAVIVSHGRNGLGAYTTGGTVISAAGASADELANTDGDARFVRREYSDAAGNVFDDSVMALTPSELLSPLALSGSIKDAAATMAGTLASMRGAIDSSIVASRVAGMAPGQASYAIPAANPMPTNDPWGNPITYTRGALSAITALSPPSALAYRLASAGPDGVAGNADDVSSPVSVAELQSILVKVGF